MIQPAGAAPSLWNEWQRFVAHFSVRNWLPLKMETLIVPYFRTEFNRCAQHLLLNQVLNGNAPEWIGRGWYQVAIAGRANDMRKVDSGWHATVFEMLVWVGFERQGERSNAIQRLASDTMRFLTAGLGLDAERIAVTAFGGGEVLPGVEVAEDLEWRNVWNSAGISSKQIHMIAGPKNYLLFVGNGERCGAKCELLYRTQTLTGDRWVEIGTLIVDDSRLTKGRAAGWRIETGAAIAAGAAFGVERLLAVIEGEPALTSITTFRKLFQAVTRRMDARARNFFESDVRILIDQSRACAFVVCSTDFRENTPQADVVSIMARRIRRKLATINCSDWQPLIGELEKEIMTIYGERHPQLNQLDGRLLDLVSHVRWPEGWNPESYSPQ
jgi:alanyl-tRNA synthetase